MRANLERHIVWEFNKEGLQLPHADLQIRVTELVRNVPTKGAKFHALLYRSMKETESKEHLVPYRSFVAFDRIEELGIIYWVAHVTLT